MHTYIEFCVCTDLAFHNTHELLGICCYGLLRVPCSKQLITYRNILTILCYHTILSSKASRLFFIFVRIVRVMPTFEMMRHAFPEPNTVLFSCRMLEKPTWKVRLEVCGESALPISSSEKKFTFKLT